MKILMRYEFLHLIGIRLWQTIDTPLQKINCGEKNSLQTEIYSTLNSPISIFAKVSDNIFVY
jgi:hypothetical protein